MGIISYGVYYFSIRYLSITEEELKELPKGEKLLPIFLKAKKIRNKIFGIKTNR